ncbi:MAG: AAA family ATPase [Ardenticatenaceae bacterium]|nr:AAA family ATPase [Ardenticatenaceae bacterium]
MRIEAFYLEGVRGLPAIDLNFIDPATNRIRPRTVIAGSNGTGKTTILDTIHALATLVLNEQHERPPAWLVSEGSKTWVRLRDLPTATPPSQALVLYAVDRKEDLPWTDQRKPGDSDVVAYGWTGRPQTDQGYGPQPAMVSALRRRIEEIKQSEALHDSLPNMLYFRSEQRELRPKQKGQILAEEDGYRWAYRFSDSQRWEGSLESFLVAMNYQDLLVKQGNRAGGSKFQQFLRVINNFLDGKQIIGVDPKSFRIQVKADNGEKFTLDALSSGEKQILLMLGEIQRRIRRGSVVLIDEPEIHLHPRWQRLLVRALTDLCAEHDAQLIMTTHSEEVAGAVYKHELILLDAIFAQVPA